MKWLENIKTRWKEIWRSGPRVATKKRRYYVGDIAPDELLNHKAEDGNLGAMISIDPETKRITAIFIP